MKFRSELKGIVTVKPGLRCSGSGGGLDPAYFVLEQLPHQNHRKVRKNMTQSCPNAKELRNLVDGSLSDIDAQSIELHIERCEACQHAIQELAADGTFWNSAAKSLSDDKIVGPSLDRVIETLQHQSREDAEEIGEAIELKLSFIEPPVEPGTIGRLRHYDILRVAGRGGMGIVLKAFDRSLRRIVAIKLLAPHLAGNGQARQRFVREGRAAAAISHEHVVTIHAVEESPPFLVMQYVHGETLEERIHRNGSLAVREAVRIALQIAQGLAAAHAQGVVHRDIKPANILLENGVARVRITDFGLARAIDDASLTQSGVVAGTPQYMAPEQASGDAIDERADLFSLGSVLYTMLAGHAPFRATTAMGVLKRLCDNAARPIREINPETPDWLVVVINRLHAKRPADRFHSATEVASLLERGLVAMQTGTTPASGWASALRVDAPSETSAAVENTTTQTALGTQARTERSEGSPGVSDMRPPTPATHQSYSSFIFTDLGAIAKLLLPPYPLWLLFALVGLAVTPLVPEAGILGGAFALIVLLAPRVSPRLTTKLLNDSTEENADIKNTSANPAALGVRNSFRAIGVIRLFAWSLLWAVPIIVWNSAFFSLEDKALSGMSYQLFAATDEIIGVLLVIVATWLLTAFFWFRQKNKVGTHLFSSATRRKGILTVAGLATIFCVCGYGTWHNKVYWPRLQQMHYLSKPQPVVPQPSVFPIRIEFEEMKSGIDVVIDNGRSPVEWASTGDSWQMELPGSPGTYPWRATMGQNIFASGEVTLKDRNTTIIKVPRPKLVDIIAGRWKSKSKSTANMAAPASQAELDIANLELEFHKETAIFANRTPGSTNRTDMTIKIDESVTPALITLLERSGEKVEGIISFESEAISPQFLESGMGTHGGMDQAKTPRMRGKHKLLICLSAPGSLRPWQFESDPKQGIVLYEFVRSDDPESLSHSLLLEPLPNETTASVVKESVEAWAKHLNVPIERRNSIGLDLTLVPPTSVDLPPNDILQKERLLLPDGTKVVDVDSPQRVPSIQSPPEPKPILSYPFVISRDVITMAQFQQFIDATGYITDAQRGEPLSKAPSVAATPQPAGNAPAVVPEGKAADAAVTNPPPQSTIGGWWRQNDQLVWQDGLNWKSEFIRLETTPQIPNAVSDFPDVDSRPSPVVMISVNDATAFCQWLSSKENRQYRLPTALEWTAANQLGAMLLPGDAEDGDANEHRTWFDNSQPNPLGVRVATEIGGEWTSNGAWAGTAEVIVIVKKDISSDGNRFDLSHQLLAPSAFRSSELSFRVVAELQAMTTKESKQPEPTLDPL